MWGGGAASGAAKGGATEPFSSMPAALSAALSESRDALEEVIEPFLLQQGLIQRTPRGRMLAQKAWTHLGLDAPKREADLFG